MDKWLYIGFVVALGMVALIFPDGIITLTMVVLLSAVIIYVTRMYSDEKDLITKIFLTALVARLAFGIFVHVFELRDFFGGDANTYDFNGWMIARYWEGLASGADPSVIKARSASAPGWGINYLVAGLYYLFGRNIFLAQSFCAVIGAATAPLVYLCAKKIFNNISVARVSALSVAFFPAFIIWSGQLLKDGLIVFLLVLTMILVLRLQEKFSYLAVVVLILAVSCILTLRFYIFYMLLVAIAGSFLIGLSNSVQSIARRTAVLVLIGIGLTYFGVIRTANIDFEKYGDLERLERSRSDLARSAASGFGEDIDVSTSQGALSALPVGFIYLMFGPFPWQMGSLRSTVVFPEMLVWWAMMPLLVVGIWYTIKNKLRTAFPILIFSLFLTIAYSIFQGNVGTAYRQRTQIQVFLFMFIAVGWVLYKERRENKKLILREKQRQFAESVRART